MNKQLNTIAVDLTPVLPSGENGGAKIFVIELLSRLAQRAPNTEFILLTQSISHEELAILDRPNMRRFMVMGDMNSNSMRLRMKRVASCVLPYLPTRLRHIAGRIGYKICYALKRNQSSSTLLSKIGADLLFCPFTAPTYFEYGIPMVCTVYDLQFKTYPEFFSAEDVAIRECNFFAASRQATILAAISEFSRKTAIDCGGLNERNVRTVYLRLGQRIASNGMGDKNIFLRKHNIVPGKYLIYPANFWKHKNHEMLLTAFGMAIREGLGSDIKLVCTGSPCARRDYMIQATKSIGLDDRVLFPGYLSDAEMKILMANCAGLIFPSLYEGFGLPLIEAMAVGVPVACSNAASLPEVASNAALLFDPRLPAQIAQAIISLIENKALRRELIEAGHKRSIQFSDGDRMAIEYWELFQLALASENRENILTGAYPDGWAGHCLNIHMAPASHPQTLEVEFTAPKWLPQQSLTVHARKNGKLQGKKLVFERGTNATMSLPINPRGGSLQLKIGPTFVPANLGHGNDERQLSVMLERCGIIRNGGEYIELFPGRIS